MMAKFEIGKQYTMRSICNHDATWTYTVRENRPDYHRNGWQRNL